MCASVCGSLSGDENPDGVNFPVDDRTPETLGHPVTVPAAVTPPLLKISVYNAAIEMWKGNIYNIHICTYREERYIGLW